MQTPQNIYNIYFPYSFSWEITKECATAPKKIQSKGKHLTRKHMEPQCTTWLRSQRPLHTDTE